MRSVYYVSRNNDDPRLAMVTERGDLLLTDCRQRRLRNALRPAPSPHILSSVSVPVEGGNALAVAAVILCKGSVYAMGT